MSTISTIPFTLEQGTVDIWPVNIVEARKNLDNYRQQLTPDEIKRAEQFKVEYKYHEFVITRGLLKLRLSEQLNLPGSEVELTTLEHGKLVLHEKHQQQNIQFNVSHSHGESLVALTLDTAIGVDIEKIRQQIEWPALSKRFFSAAEYEALKDYDDDKCLSAFFSCWTRKEAFVKAVGDGIAFGLKEFDVNVDPDSAAKLLRTYSNAGAVKDWSLYSIDVTEGFVATLAVNRSESRVRVWE